MGALVMGMSMGGMALYMRQMKKEMGKRMYEAMGELHQSLSSIEVRLDFNGCLWRDKVRHLKMRLTSLRACVVNDWDEEKAPCTVEMRVPLMRSWLLYEHDTMRSMASDEKESNMAWMSLCTLCYISTFKVMLRIQMGLDELTESPFGSDWI